MATKNFCKAPECEMHTFVLHVGLRGNHSDEKIEALKAELAVFLKTQPENSRNIQPSLKQHLVGFLNVLLDRINTLVWVDKIGSSFFIVISVQDGKNMVIWALHQSLNRLRHQASKVVGQFLTDREQVPLLGLPKVLEEDVKDFIPTHGE
eukprot:GFUD01028007.1.p1 GENE.GFUD01028007.1~~GFUD01028007.1.p1  ORF type:complete len:150 (+),score=32.74 GFUD01028007.1:90-539(+)